MRQTAIVVCAVLLGVACSSDDEDDATDAVPAMSAPTTTSVPIPTRTEVEHRTLQLVDRSRPTPATDRRPGSDQRLLKTDLYIPAGTGPFPLIAFSHWCGGHPQIFSGRLGAWADAGYAVVAPAFPLSNKQAPGGPGREDVQNQPGDISFVLDEVLAAGDDDSSPLYGAFDPDRIGAAGVSLGAFTTYGVAFGGECCLDDRIKAAITMDGRTDLTDGPGFDVDVDSGLPLMIMHADGDFVVPYSAATEPYSRATPPKWLVTLHVEAHAEPYNDMPNPTDELVRQVTAAFWDRYLSDEEAAEQRLVSAIEAGAALASVESDPG